MGAEGLPAAGPNGLFSVADRPAAPALGGDAVSGPAVNASRGRGHVQVVNFWGSWCGPCRAEAAALSLAARETSGDGVLFLGVDVKEDRSSAARFEQAHHTPYPSLFDQPGVVSTRFHRFAPRETPTTVLLDREGRIARVLPGQVRLAELLVLIKGLVAEP
jgi:thiol-disulfide isomerase/thioredoxin